MLYSCEVCDNDGANLEHFALLHAKGRFLALPPKYWTRL
jgi:hypothetical protein